MKYLTLFITFLWSFVLNAQVAFDENFDAKIIGTNLTDDGYTLTKGSTYTGNVTAVVTESNGNKFARMVADVNASANMQIAKVITVEPGKTYTYEADSRGAFKRQLRIYSENDLLLGSSVDYKPATTAEETEWKKLQLVFIPASGITKIKIGLFQYWSGTIDIDNFKVYSSQRQTSYYISSSGGNDSNTGTKNAPWRSLDKLSATTLWPGDTVFFKCGDQFNGRYVVNGSGISTKPILITAYGEGEKPIISGKVGADGGGDYEEAILVENNDNLIFDNIEVQNERLVTRSGVADTDAYGIYVKNSGGRVMKNLIFNNVTIKNVFAVQPMILPEDFDKIQVAALSFYCTKNTTIGSEKNISDIEIKNCYFANNQRFGVQLKHAGGNDGVGNDSINRNMNIYIHNNEFYYNGGSGVLPNSTYNCLIENNIFDHPGASTDPRMPARGSSVWNYNAINTIVQYNNCLSTRGYLDSYGIHIDKHNKNTFVQYNYMDDCIGGFVEILADNVNAVYRFNVSLNSGFRYSSGVSTWKAGSSTIYVYSDRWVEPNQAALQLSDGIYIYNNTVVMNKEFTTTFNVDAKNISIYNNIFSSTNGATMGYLQFAVNNNGTPFTMKNNLYHGNVNPNWVSMDAAPINADPLFVGTGDNAYAFQLQAGSAAINKGMPDTGPKVTNAGYGIFNNIPVYPTVDLYGNSIDLSSGTPNIGACNSKTGEIFTLLGKTTPQVSHWQVAYKQSMALLQCSNKKTFSGSLNISLVNLKGQIVLSENRFFDLPVTSFVLNLTPEISGGVYVLNIKNNRESESRRIVICR